MQRRKFIHNIAWLTAGLMGGGFIPAKAFFKKDAAVKGQVSANGKPLKDVVVSDGYSVVVTDKKGRFELQPHPEAVAVFISTPAGYAFPHKKGIARHYRLLQDADARKEINFELSPLEKNDDEHQFIIWADPQVKNAKDVQKMMDDSVPDVQKLVAAAGTGALLHGITVGDIVWDNHDLFGEYDKAVAQMGIPFFQCLGNHDMDYNKGGDETSDDTFQQLYGPTYY